MFTEGKTRGCGVAKGRDCRNPLRTSNGVCEVIVTNLFWSRVVDCALEAFTEIIYRNQQERPTGSYKGAWVDKTNAYLLHRIERF
jgi:hypothetical protein